VAAVGLLITMGGACSSSHDLLTEALGELEKRGHEGKPEAELPKFQVKPVFECLEPSVDGGYVARFGYTTTGTTAVNLPVGPLNGLYPGSPDKGQPTTFLPGRHDGAIRVKFQPLYLMFVLDGNVALATTWSRRCEPPQVTCPASCDDGNACTIDSCNASTSFKCSHSPSARGTACDDKGLCTIDDVCDGAGACVGAPRSCPAVSQCHLPGTCDPGTGLCGSPVAPDQQACNDGLTCTAGDRCLAGVCRGEALVCGEGSLCSEPAGCSSPPARQCPETSWARALPGMGASGLLATLHGQATNDAGELFVGGAVWGDVGFPNGVNVSVGTPGDSDLLIAKVNREDGSFAWAKTFGDGQRQTVRKMASNNQGVLGFFGDLDGQISLGGGVTVGPPAAQRPDGWAGTFIAGVSSQDGSGVFALDLQFPDGGLNDIAASPVDGSFVVCGIRGSYLRPDTDVDAYVAKFSGRGELLWNALVALAGSERDSCDAVTVLDDGDVVFGGIHGHAATRALGVTKLDGTTGAKKWSRLFPLTDTWIGTPDTAIAQVTDVAADASGDVVLSGTLWDRIDLGSRVGTLAVSGTLADSKTLSSDALVIKVAGGSGEAVWGKLVGQPPVAGAVAAWEEGVSIAVDSRGDVHLTVNERTPFMLSPTAAHSGWHDIRQLKINGQDGSVRCTRVHGGEEGQTSGELLINRRGLGAAKDQAFHFGFFNKVIDLGPGAALQAPFDHAYFLTRFLP
jgi:hypothetical protein